MTAHTFDDERRASDPATEPEVLEHLAKTFPALRPVVAANPGLPAVLREQLLRMGAGDPPQTSPASPLSAGSASSPEQLRTAETAALPSASTADYSISPYVAVPEAAALRTDPPTAVLGASSALPPPAIPPLSAAGSAPTAAPAPPVNLAAAPTDSRPRSHTGLIAALVITLVLVVAAAGTFAGMLLANRNQQSETKADGTASSSAAPALTEGAAAGQATRPAAEPTSESSTEQSATATAEEAPTLSDEPTLPASAKTYSYRYVDTPSKNISCVLSEEGVGCSILDRTYASSGMQDCAEREFSISVGADLPRLRCGEEFLGQPGSTFHTLQYGETTTFSGYTCTSRAEGMTCWSMSTGLGFTISRDSYNTFQKP